MQKSLGYLVKLVRMVTLKSISLVPVLLAMSPLNAQVSSEDHSSHHGHHITHGSNDDASASTMIMGKTTFVVTNNGASVLLDQANNEIKFDSGPFSVSFEVTE